MTLTEEQEKIIENLFRKEHHVPSGNYLKIHVSKAGNIIITQIREEHDWEQDICTGMFNMGTKYLKKIGL
jgi:hypothetical protein